MHVVEGHIIDIVRRKIFPGTISVQNGRITSIEAKADVPDKFILPGFIDSHIHIESSMLTPYEFAKSAVVHGTVATVSDPHEIANVCGMEGIQYMIENARHAAIKIFFGAPSCVPATTFENAGAVIGPTDVQNLLSSPDIWYLSEMMNYPGVLNKDAGVMAKIQAAVKAGKPIDGHSPGLRGNDAKTYISAGIQTDHECVSLEEAIEKVSLGMRILIREGSAAKNFEELHPLIEDHPQKVMFCSDDKHPDDLIEGHINQLVKRALKLGYDLFDVLQIACLNPVKHYNLPVGTLQVGDPADFIVVGDTQDWPVLATYINGVAVYEDKTVRIPAYQASCINQFAEIHIREEDLRVKAVDEVQAVIEAIDGSLITEKQWCRLPVRDGFFVTDPSKDILKICVVNRYVSGTLPAVGWITGFGLKEAAIASTVAHDSHNLICIGTDDGLMLQAMDLLIESKGGLSCVTKTTKMHLPLPVAGLMTDQPAQIIAKEYVGITTLAKNAGCSLHAPFMTLSFMALLVIPKIKMSDLGLFDAEAFQFYP